MQAIYSATATSTGGRDGRSVSSDNKLDLALSTPKELGGAGGEGTNPEQLFAAGYSACFIGALKLVASQQKVKIPNDVNVTATIGIGANTKGEGFTVCADLEVNVPGVEKDVVEQLVEAIKHGVRKINIDTDLRLASTGAMRRMMAEQPSEFDPRKFLAKTTEAMRDICIARYESFGCAGHASKISPLSLTQMQERYDASTDTWTMMQPMPDGRSSHAACVVGDFIYVLGGLGSGTNLVSSVLKFCPATDTWTEVAPMPTARDGLSVCVLGPHIYCTGGYNGRAGGRQSVVECLDTTSGTWTTLKPLPVFRLSRRPMIS